MFDPFDLQGSEPENEHQRSLIEADRLATPDERKSREIDLTGWNAQLEFMRLTKDKFNCHLHPNPKGHVAALMEDEYGKFRLVVDCPCRDCLKAWQEFSAQAFDQWRSAKHPRKN